MGIAELPEREPSEQASVPARTDGSSRRVALTTLALTLTNGLSVLWKTQATHRGVTAAGFALSLAPDRKGDSLFAALMSHGTESASPPPPSPSATWSAADTATVGVAAAGAITNTGEVSLPWSFASQANLTITPSAGTLAAGGTQPLSIVAAAAATYVMTLVSAGASITGNDQTMVATVAAVAPTSATLSGSSSATTGVAHTSTVTLDHPADQAYTITWSRTGGATGVSTSTITTGQTAVSADDTWATAGSGSVDFTISPSLTRSGRPLSVTIADPAAPGALPSITLAPAVSGTLPFAFGHAFRQGDVPAGQVANAASATDWQCTPMTYWPDGSLKHAIIAGRAAVTSGVDLALALTAGAAAGGAALTESDLTTALGGTAVVIGVDADNTTLGSLIGTAALHTTVCTGPVMSSWVYRRAVSGNAHLVVFMEVRLFKGGAVEIFPWVENGYLTVASPTNWVKTCSVTIGGVSRFSQSIDIKHHTRIPLISGSAFSYWVGTDPAITPKHDRSYFVGTKLIPNVGAWGAPGSTALNALLQSYTPNTLANDDNATGSTGGAGSIVAPTHAMYVSSGGDARAYKAMMTHALSSGSWSCHFRDESTQRPVLWASWPNAEIGDGTIPAGTGGTNHVGGPEKTHLPGYAYLPWLVTGRWWFMEEMHHWLGWEMLHTTAAYRNYAVGTIDTGSGYTVRGAAWALNITAQAASVTPASYPLRAQCVARWESSMASFYGKYIAGTVGGGAYVNAIGLLGSYSGYVGQTTLYSPTNPSTAWWDAAYQHNYVAAVLGYSSDIGIPQSGTSQTQHAAVRNHSYKLVVGRADDGYQGRYNWRHFIAYALPIGTDDTGLPPESYYTTHAQIYAELVSGYGLAALDPALGGTLKKHSEDGDLAAGTSSLSYGGSALAVLAMAAEHSAPGATAGWDRVTSASNFTASFDTVLREDEAHWGIAPRQPTWKPVASGGVAQISTGWAPSTLNAAVGRSVLWWTAWSTIAYLPWYGRHGAIVAGGGGHVDGTENDLALLDIGTYAWTKIKPNYTGTLYLKSHPSATPYTSHGSPVDGFLYANGTAGDYTTVSGEQTAVHNYGGLLALPDNAIAGGGGNGWLFRAGLPAMSGDGNVSSKIGHKLRVGVDTLWTVHGSNPQTAPQSSYSGAAYDPKRGRIWFKEDTSNPSSTYYYRNASDGSSGSQAMTGIAAWGRWYSHLDYSSRHDALCEVIDGQTFIFVDLVTNIAYNPLSGATGAPPSLAPSSWGACWSDVWNCFVYVRGVGDSAVYFLKPTGDPRSAPWAWSSQSTNVALTDANSHPAFGRIRHITALGNVLAWFGRENQAPQLIGVTAP